MFIYNPIRKGHDLHTRIKLARDTLDFQFFDDTPIEQQLNVSELSLNRVIEDNLIPNNKTWLYKITVGGKQFIGCTLKNIKEEESNFKILAKEGSKHPVCIALRRYGYIYNFEAISEHKNEVLALISEISEIEKTKPELNPNIGGLGTNYNIIEKENNFSELVFYVQDKKKFYNNGKYTISYLKKIAIKIKSRFEKKTQKFSQIKKNFVWNFGDTKNITSIELIFNNCDDFNRKLIFEYYKIFYRMYMKLLNWDENDYFCKVGYFKKYPFLMFLKPQKSITWSDPFQNGKIVEIVFGSGKRFFNLSLFPEAKRMILIDNLEIEDMFLNKKKAINKIKKLDWFVEGKKNNVLKKGDIFWAIYIECGTYETGGFFNKKIKKNSYSIHLTYEELI